MKKEVKVGDTVYVCDQQEGHQFPIGTEVEILKINKKKDAHLCTDGVHKWWLISAEFETLD